MNSRDISALASLDARLSGLKPVSQFAVPRRGWIRAIRDALGMTASQMGDRIGIRAQSVLALEKSESAGTIRLDSLRKAAAALDCTLVYAIVPNAALEETVTRRARQVARRELARVDHTMDLEDQGISAAQREARLDAYVRDHVRLSDIWKMP